MAKESYNPFQLLPDPTTYQDKRVQDLLDENKSPYGKATMVEIVARSAGATGEQHLVNRDDLSTAFNPPEGYDRAQWASKLRTDGYTTLAEMYEAGATANREVAIIPTEEHTRTTPNTDEPHKGELAYLIQHLPTREMARGFYDHIQAIAGRNADTTYKLELINEYLRPINFDERGGYRPDAERLTAAREALTQMGEITAQLQAVEFSKDDLMEQGGASGNSEYILEARGAMDQELARMEAEDRTEFDRDSETEGRQIVYDQREVFSASHADEFEVTEYELAEERYEEQDFEAVREGAVFNTSAIRIGGLDQQTSLPGNEHIITDQYLVGTAMPSITEALRLQISPQELVEGARNVQRFAGHYLDQQQDVARILSAERGQALAQRYNAYQQGQLSSADAERLGQDILNAGLSRKETATLLEHSAYLGNKETPDLTDHLKAHGAHEYQHVQEIVRANSLNSFELQQLAQSPEWAHKASRDYATRAQEFALRANAPEGEHTHFREMYADRLKMGERPMTAEREMIFAERVLMNPHLSPRDKELLLAPNPHWETSQAGQRQVNEYVRNYNDAQAERPLRIEDRPGREAYRAQQNAREYASHLATIETARAKGASPADIKAEYRSLARFTEQYAQQVLREDAYVREGNRSPVFQRAVEALHQQKTADDVEKMARQIRDFNNSNAAKQRAGAETSHRKFTTEQRALLANPGPHTQHYTPEMHRALHDTLLTAQDKRNEVERMQQGKTQLSEPVQKIMAALDQQRDRAGRPDIGKLNRFAALVNPNTKLSRVMTPQEQSWQLRENVVQLRPTEKDFVYQQVTSLRAESLLHAPEKASPRAQEVVTRIQSARDHDTLHQRLEEAISKQEGLPTLNDVERRYVNLIAKQASEELHLRRDAGERLYGAVAIHSRSYQAYAEAITAAKADPKTEVVTQVRMVADGQVTVRLNPESKEFLSREIAKETWVATIPDEIHRRKDYAEARGQSVSEKDPTAHQVFKQVETMREYQNDVLNARDALNRHKQEIVARVAEAQGQEQAASAGRTEWANTWKSGLQEPGYKAVLEGRKDELVPLIKDHYEGRANSQQFSDKLATLSLPEGSREYLREAATRAETARHNAIAESREQVNNNDFTAQAMQQATPQEREMLQAFQHSELTAREKYYGGFEKLDRLVDQAMEREPGLERSTERTEVATNREQELPTDQALTARNVMMMRDDQQSDYTHAEEGRTNEQQERAENIERALQTEPARTEIAAAAPASIYDEMFDR